MYNKIRILCEKKGVSITRVEKETGLSNGAIGKWKDSTPTVEKLKKVADYFGVTVDELITEQEG